MIMSEATEQYVSLAQLKTLLATNDAEIKAAFNAAVQELAAKGDGGKLDAATTQKLEHMAAEAVKVGDKILKLEQKLIGGIGDQGQQIKTLGEQFISLDGCKSMNHTWKGTVTLDIKRSLGSEIKTAIINGTGASQALVPAHRLDMIIEPQRRVLTVRDLLPTMTTSSNLIEFPKENVFTNNAAPQVGGSPQAFENVTKPESAITFTLGTAAVVTLAHWIPASKQVLSDAPALKAYIDTRLMYGLKLKEEDQLLNGNGSNGNLSGLMTNATAYVPTSPQMTNEIDIIRHAIKQAQVSEYMPDALLLNPSDWYDIDVRKVGTGDARYIVGNPREMSVPRLWGLPVVVTNSIASGSFLLGAFGIGAAIWDREQASIQTSTENSDNFVKNMVTILAEERIALTVFRSAAFVKGTL